MTETHNKTIAHCKHIYQNKKDDINAALKRAVGLGRFAREREMELSAEVVTLERVDDIHCSDSLAFGVLAGLVNPWRPAKPTRSENYPQAHKQYQYQSNIKAIAISK